MRREVPERAVRHEDGAAVKLDALANASDVDTGSVLSVVGVPAQLPAGVTYDAQTHSFSLNPADAAYQSLAAGQTTTVTVSYGVSDGTVTIGASVGWTVTGVAELTPVAVPAYIANHFPVAPKDISHVTFYFEQSPDDDILNLHSVKIDNVPGRADDDLDAWIQQAVDYVRAHDPALAQGAELLGAALKYSTTELYYALDGNTDIDPVPGGVLIQGPNLNASFDYSVVFG